MPARCGRLAATLNGGILTVTLNRPELANAIDGAMSREMTALLPAVAADDAVRVVVLRGAGGDFCAGLDASDFFDPDGRDTAELRALRDTADEWRVRALRRLHQPYRGDGAGRLPGRRAIHPGKLRHRPYGRQRAVFRRGSAGRRACPAGRPLNPLPRS